MKRILSTAFAFCFALALLAGCNADSPSSSTIVRAPETSSGSSVTSVPLAYDVNELLLLVVDAANLGDTIEMTITDLTYSGDVSADDIVAVAGRQSTQYVENGGQVAVIQTVAGRGEAVKSQLENFRDKLLSENNYRSDFPDAYDNFSDIRIAVSGDFIIFASSATGTDGGYDALDAAIAAAFA